MFALARVADRAAKHSFGVLIYDILREGSTVPMTQSLNH